MTSSSSSSSPEIPTPAAATTSADPQDRFSYKHATHDEVLEDLSSRFILNLPDEELASLERICFQVEQAHWFYEDFIREENPKFPSLPLKKFSAMLFHACPLLHEWSHDNEQAFNKFMQYKTRVPVCGAIMLNDAWEKCVLVKGWKSSSGWGFPKGKINEDEPEPNCAIREVLEETGYNLSNEIDPDNVIEMSIREQKISLYIVPGVPEDYPFKTKTRKEISKIEWFKLTDLPTWRRNKTAPGKFYLISPFIGALKAFINERKPRGLSRKAPPKGRNSPLGHSAQVQQDDDATTLSSDVTYHTQESSSQSSADPQTPSPQYPESVALVVNGTRSDENDFTKAMATDNLDPHFARLLTSLSLSATATVDSKSIERHQLQPLAIKTHEPILAEPATPVPVTASSNSNSNPLADPVDRGDWSSSVPRRLSERSATLSANARGISTIDGRTVLAHPSVGPSWSFTTPSTVFVTPHANGIISPRSHQLQTPPHSDALSSSSVTVGISSSTTSRGLSSHRNSSTADISPYLTRPVDMPMTGKRLKQLALLEAVADESSRMTPLLTRPELPATGIMTGMRGPMSPAGRYQFMTGSEMSVPPPFATSNDPSDLRMIYSSGPGIAQPTPPAFSSTIQAPTHPQSLHDDAFRVRPRTSHTYHGGIPLPHLPGSMSMNQRQLLAMMNGTRVAPSYYPAPPHIGSPFTQISSPSQGKLGQHPSQALMTPAFFPAHSTPLTASRGLNLPADQKQPLHNSHLLSILNGNAPAGPESVPLMISQPTTGVAH